TNPRRHGHEKRSRVGPSVAVGPMPAQVRLLRRVLGVGHRPEHEICETQQAPTVWLAARGRIRHRALGVHAVRREGARASPPMTMPISPTLASQSPSRSNLSIAPRSAHPIMSLLLSRRLDGIGLLNVTWLRRRGAGVL